MTGVITCGEKGSLTSCGADRRAGVCLCRRLRDPGAAQGVAACRRSDDGRGHAGRGCRRGRGRGARARARRSRGATGAYPAHPARRRASAPEPALRPRRGGGQGRRRLDLRDLDPRRSGRVSARARRVVEDHERRAGDPALPPQRRDVPRRHADDRRGRPVRPRRPARGEVALAADARRARRRAERGCLGAARRQDRAAQGGRLCPARADGGAGRAAASLYRRGPRAGARAGGHRAVQAREVGARRPHRPRAQSELLGRAAGHRRRRVSHHLGRGARAHGRAAGRDRHLAAAHPRALAGRGRARRLRRSRARAGDLSDVDPERPPAAVRRCAGQARRRAGDRSAEDRA